MFPKSIPNRLFKFESEEEFRISENLLSDYRIENDKYLFCYRDNLDSNGDDNIFVYAANLDEFIEFINRENNQFRTTKEEAYNDAFYFLKGQLKK